MHMAYVSYAKCFSVATKEHYYDMNVCEYGGNQGETFTPTLQIITSNLYLLWVSNLPEAVAGKISFSEQARATNSTNN